jgi:hypothetical protein
MDDALRSQRARLGGLSTAARGHVNTRPALAAAEGRFQRQVIEQAEAAGEQLAPDELAKRTAAARRLFYARLAYQSAQARRVRAATRRGYAIDHELTR